jgi:hypothetical protein
MTGMCIFPRNVERNAARSAHVFDLATARDCGRVPGDAPQGMTSPLATGRVPHIEAQLAELTTLVTAEP